MILIVRHGPGRGRDGAYLQEFLDELSRSHPPLFSQLRFWETGSAPAELDGVETLVFWLADPLRERYPDCFAEALALDREAERRGLRRINPPASLSNTRKSVQGEIWTKAGIPTPPQSHYTTRAQLLAAASSFPIILRSETQHSQRRMKVLRSRARLERKPDKVLPYPGALAPFLDLRRGHPRGPWSRFHHRKRAAVMGDRVLPLELFFSRKPIVCAKTSLFRRYQRGRFASRFPAATRWVSWEHGCIEADLEYFEQGDGHAELLITAARALGLEWCAIDYSEDGSGDPVLWEANPYFDFPPPDEWHLANVRKATARRARLAECMAGWLEALLEPTPSAP